MSYPLVSIIIPVFNAEKYLAETITSALNQTWENKEIIIVDDGSTDNSFMIASRFESKTVRVLKQENSGASVARNTALKEAKGEYIQFLDADDLLSPDKIEAQINCLNGSVTHVALCNTIYFNEKENHLDGTITNEWFCRDSDDPVDFLIKLYAGDEVMPGYGGMIQPNAWLTPNNIIKKAGLWNEFRCPDDDGEFFCRVILASNGVKFSHTGLNYYRKFINSTSLSGQKTLEAYKNIVLSIDLKYGYLKQRTNDPILETIFAQHYWWNGVNAYPMFKDVSNYCIQKAKQFHYKGPRYVGGPVGHFVTRFFGWKLAKYLSHNVQLGYDGPRYVDHTSISHFIMKLFRWKLGKYFSSNEQVINKI